MITVDIFNIDNKIGQTQLVQHTADNKNAYIRHNFFYFNIYIIIMSFMPLIFLWFIRKKTSDQNLMFIYSSNSYGFYFFCILQMLFIKSKMSFTHTKFLIAPRSWFFSGGIYIVTAHYFIICMNGRTQKSKECVCFTLKI